jgi:rubrerythrin
MDPQATDWLKPFLWICPRCWLVLHSKENMPRCPKCGFKEGT